MRARAWVVSLSALSMLVLGGFGLGCGSITPVETGTGGSGGSSSTAGTGGPGNGGAGGGAGVGGGMAGSTGSAGTTGAGGSVGGRGGNPDTVGTGGGGGATGGHGGGTTGIGGMANGGRGGITATGVGGVGGIGGLSTGGRGGGAGTGGTGGTMCARGACPALAIADLEAIDDSKAPGFDAPGFRCKSLTICPPGSACIYYSANMFGSLQSAEDTYSDGVKLTAPMAVRLLIDGGAASQCGNPAVTFAGDEYVTLTFDGGKKVAVYLPMFMGTTLSLYVATDGSTFYDAALTMPARLRPTN